MEQETTQLRDKVEKQLKLERKRQLPIYVGDIEKMMDRVAYQVPIATGDMMYNMEVDTQERIYLAILGIGLLALILGVMF